MAYTVFYSWQSDISRKINRNFIEEALKEALLNIGQDFDLDQSLRENLVFDQGTEGVPGTPPISDTIFSKIQNCAIYVADMTFVGQSDEGRSIPNPNVLIEYGCAIHSVRHSRIIPIMNVAFGEPISGKTPNMPFDMRHLRNPITYSLKANSSLEKYSQTKHKLVQKLTEAILVMLKSGVLKDLIQEKKALSCPFCGVRVDFGRTVCLGCKAEVVYGATPQESQQAFLFGVLGGGILCTLLFSELPKWLAFKFGWPLVSGWGLGTNIFWPGAALTALTVYASVYLTKNSYLKLKPRFFRRTNL